MDREFLNFDIVPSKPIESFILSPSLQFTEGNLNPGGVVGKQNGKEIIAYSMKSKLKYKENLTIKIPRETKPMIGLDPSNVTSPLDDDPISKFISCNSLSAWFHTSIANLDKIETPRNIQKAL